MYPEKGRFRIFREHKYIVYVFCQILERVAKVDFTLNLELESIKKSCHNLFDLLKSHAEYEDSRIRPLLDKKGSKLYDSAYRDHADHEVHFKKFIVALDIILSEDSSTEKINLGYNFYLDLRDFFSEMLKHLSFEERTILQELQNLLSDDEIKEIDHVSYREMLPAHMVDMMQVLMPVFNRDDRLVFFNDMYDAEREKFLGAWESIKVLISENESKEFEDYIANIK